jgi:hypothetical protein
MQKCPYCDELIQIGALKCRYCKEWLPKNEEEKSDINIGDITEEQNIILKKIKKLKKDDEPFFIKAIEKYFDKDRLTPVKSFDNGYSYCENLAFMLFKESYEALEALMKIYGLVEED